MSKKASENTIELLEQCISQLHEKTTLLYSATSCDVIYECIEKLNEQLKKEKAKLR